MRHPASFHAILCLWILLPAAAGRAGAEDREVRVRRDKDDILAGGRWFYNDLEKGIAEAKTSGKPLLVVLRCIPCEACRGFDEQVAGFDKRVQELLDRFVRVRIPQTNGLDLSLFQFDYDLSFYAFFLNADRTIYGRFGTRSTQEDKTGDVSIAAFREAMEAALSLHDRFDRVKDSLKGKTGKPAAIRTPEEYPSLKGKYKSTIDYEGKVVQSCIHCHQIRDAERLIYRSAGKPLPEAVLFPWPLPDVFGMHLDPKKRASIARVDGGSSAEQAGFRAGDELMALNGQPIISIADVQWVLEQSGETGELTFRTRRRSEERDMKISLSPGWRKKSELSWRVSSWELRRMGTGGLRLEELSAEDQQKAGVAADRLALRVKHAGEYGEHATAKQAGVRKGDIILSIDGRDARLRETDFMAYTIQEKRPGDAIVIVILRDGEKKELSFKMK